RHLSWFLAGDFNRSPDRLENDLMTEHLERVVAAHALASGGPDAAAIVRVTINFFRQPQMRHLSWFLAGDFNRSPDRLENDLMTEHLERVVA
ncbi:hypothetical protein QWO81_24145, partial [Salmonella enterica subsp. enterica serovar Typhimurium]|nr:hypothetical protein [Salmonella enterica subsp. enterica serovar Typhimurium]